ncbi:GAF domain-containing sensor histidine kinase [Pseudoalteromonas sp. SSDWG2]|uniref:GAF domain-containing sensor histidine kinase n=1 Tax=Pseudoalteromonas sp. SSDWG2 TaxID=3139391 RepID=UPI003BA95C7E
MKEKFANVTVRGKENPVQVSIMDFDDDEFQNKVFEQWQRVLDLIAKIYDIPAALVMRLHENDIEVFAKSNSEGNPYEQNETAALGAGLYCETVIGSDSSLEVENALEDDMWKDNPDVPLNMISYLGVPLKWPSGEVFGTICVLDSKTRKFHELNKQLLEECRNTLEKDLEMIVRNNELRDSLELLQRTQQRVIDMERSKLTSSLVSNITHEINTPLGIALTTASALDHLIERLPDNNEGSLGASNVKAEFKEFNALLNNSLGKAKGLIESYKQVAAEQGKGQKARFNLLEHLHSLSTIMDSDFEQHHTSCEIVCPSDLELTSYSGLLSQLLILLFNNTLQHAFKPHQGGKITLVARVDNTFPEEQVAIIEYRDSGVGIDDEHVDSIFDPFFTLSDNPDNSGMGLGIARDIVENSLQGDIRCVPNPRGAYFIISLPLETRE